MKKITKILKKKFKNFNPKLKEECGVFGISDNQDASTLSTLGLHALQHRGQEGCGIVTLDGKNFYSERRLGLVGDNFTKGKISSGGRNNLGRITSRAKGAGHKKRFRIIDFFRNKIDVNATVERIEYDPNRTSYIALIKYEDNTRYYIICPQNLNVGDKIISGNN